MLPYGTVLAAIAELGASAVVIQRVGSQLAIARVGLVVSALATAGTMLKDTITGDLTYMFEHPWLQVNGKTVYSQIFLGPPTI